MPVFDRDHLLMLLGGLTIACIAAIHVTVKFPKSETNRGGRLLIHFFSVLNVKYFFAADLSSTNFRSGHVGGGGVNGVDVQPRGSALVENFW